MPAVFGRPGRGAGAEPRWQREDRKNLGEEWRDQEAGGVWRERSWESWVRGAALDLLQGT